MATWTSQRTGRWNDDAANASSPWNGGGNPASGVPANTDTVTVALTHDVEFDADQSGFASGITLAVNGTLHASTTAGAYTLKLAANMTGSGTLRAGTSGTPYPTNCTFTINRNGFQITTTSMTLDLNCSEPTTKYVKLSGVEAAGQTILSVDTDVTAETAHWVDGALVRICDVNFGNDNAEHTIAAGGVAATTITVTAGLAAQKETGAYIVLVSRNVKITHTNTTGNGISGGSNHRIFAEIRNAASGIAGAGTSAVGGSISGCSNGISGETSVSCTISSMICGCTNGISGGFGQTLIGALLVGNANSISTGQGFLTDSTTTIAGSALGITRGSNNILNGCSIFGCTTGIDRGSVVAANVSMNNTSDVSALTSGNFFNCSFSGTTEFSDYTSTTRNIVSFAESVNHDATANVYKAWTKGGIVTSNVVTVYTGRPRSFQHACESASYYVFRNYSVTVEAGGGLVVQCYVRKDALMAYLPRVWILLPGVEPFISGSADYEDIMTDSVDTWEELNLVYANGGSSPVTVTVRTLAKNATGNVYFDPIITTLAPATYDVYNTLLGYVDSLETRLTAARAGYLDNLSAGAVALQSSVDDLEGRLTAGRAANLDNLDAAVSGLSTLTAQQVWEYATRTLSGISVALAQTIADELLKRGVSNVQNTAGTGTLAEIILAAFESERTAALWTIYKTDHTTVFNTRAITTDPNAPGVIEVD